MYKSISYFLIVIHRITKALNKTSFLAIFFVSLETFAGITPPLTGSDSENILPASFPQAPQTRQNLDWGATYNRPIDYSAICNPGDYVTGTGAETNSWEFTYTYDYSVNWAGTISGHERTRTYQTFPRTQKHQCRKLNPDLLWRPAP